MARTGSTGLSTNPFGTGSLGGLSQYNLGDSLRDLERYQAEVAWSNGQLPDEDYLKVLRNDVQAAAPGTRDYIAAVNRLDDTTYRINRQKADQQGLDALIAFDQQTLATMREDNLRYRDVKDSLASELARRRSRDYGDLVDAYNDGTGGSTESLLAWVRQTRAALADDAPDKDDWENVEGDLVNRIEEEKDAKVYQDYQQRRMKPEAFLAYVKGRRDSFDPDSPKYDEWSRRYEDAAKSVKDTLQATKDQAFFNKYNEGKVSDKAYLRYIRTRLNSMDKDDPAREEWRHRLSEATFSLAEDLLVFQVNRGKKSVGTLVNFYKDYRSSLNKGSAEYRRITEKIISLGGASSGGGSGGGGSAGGGTGTGTGKGKGGGKVLDKNGGIDSYLAYLMPGVNSKNRSTGEKFLNLNYDSLQNAVTRGDKVWVFYDPKKPGQRVQARDPLTGEPVVDKNGKPVLIPGTRYLNTSSQALAELDLVKAQYNYNLAADALGRGDASDYAMYLGRALNSQDHARYVQAKSVVRDVTQAMDVIDKGIEYAESVNDPATVINLLRQQGNLINQALADGGLDESRRIRLESKLDELAKNPLWPSGDGSGMQTGGYVDIANSPRDADGNLIPGAAVLNPNVRFVLDRIDQNGKARPGYVYDDGPPGTWELNHRTINTTRDGVVVRGEVEVKTAPTNQMLVIRTDTGEKMVPLGGGAQYISYTDARGDRVHAYSIDNGKTWLQTDGVRVPVVSLTNPGLRYEESPDGTVKIVDSTTGKTAVEFDGEAWKVDEEWYAANAKTEWYGQSDRQLNRDRFSAKEIGGGGMRGQVKTTNADGSINFIPEETRLRRYAEAKADKSLAVSRRTGGEGARGAEAFEAADDQKRAKAGDAVNARYASSYAARSAAAKKAELDRFDAASGDSRTNARIASLTPGGTRRVPRFVPVPVGLAPTKKAPDKLPTTTVPGARPALGGVNAATGFVLPTKPKVALPKVKKVTPAALRNLNRERNIDKAEPRKKPRRVLPKPRRATTTTSTGARAARPISSPQAM